MKKLIVYILMGCALLYGQNFNGTSLSMAGSYSALVKGIDAVGWNPAGLALDRGNTFELNLISLNSAFFNDAFSWHTYNRYFTAEGNPDNYLSASEKKDFLDLFSDNRLTLNTDVALNVFGIAFNNFGMAVQAIAGGSVGATNIKPLEIALNGLNLTEDYNYNVPKQVDGAVFSAVKISFAYAYPFSIKKYVPGLRPVSVGIGVNYYVGMGVAQVLDSPLSINRVPAEGDQEEYIRILGKARARYAVGEDGPTPVGSGRGIDFGLSSGYGKKWRFALSFTNIGASINWSANTNMRIRAHSDSIPVGDLFSNDNNNEVNSTDTDTSLAISSFSTPLPAVMRVGGVYQIKKNWLVSAEWQQGLNKAFGNSTTPRISAGTEYAPLPWLPLRTGMSIGGRESFLWGMGFGLRFRFVDFNYSFAMKNALWPTHSEGLFTSLSLKIKI